jgi:hypothetical protein
MNTDQLNSLIRSILKIIGAAFVAHGLTNAGSIVNSPDVIGVVLTLAGLIWSHYSASQPPSTPPSQPTLPLSVLLALLLPAAALVGCASAPTNAYKAEAATDATVSAAMTAWGSYVAANHPPASEEMAVRNAFEKYQQAELLAIDATAIYAAAVSTNSTAPFDAITAASSNAAQSITDLVNLMRQFGVKI